MVPATRLQQQDSRFRIGRKAIGEYTSTGAGAHDDVVEMICFGVQLPSPEINRMGNLIRSWGSAETRLADSDLRLTALAIIV